MVTDIIPYDYPEAVASFLVDIGLVKSVDEIEDTPEKRLAAVIEAVGSLFSLEVPTIGTDPMEILQQIARDTKLANIARERAFYRLYLLTRKTKTIEDGIEVPMWYGITTDENQVMTTQEEFIGWFTSKSGLGRASTFRRIRVYQRLEEFGISGQDAWLKVLKMPNAMQELMQLVAEWERNVFKGVDEGMALRIAEKVMPSQVGHLTAAFNGNYSVQAVKEAYTPVVQAFFADATTYESAKEALEYVKLDILGRPTVKYRWIPDEQVIGVSVTTPIIQDGKQVSESRFETVLYIDAEDPPEAMMHDLFKRLPIGNRHELPGS